MSRRSPTAAQRLSELIARKPVVALLTTVVVLLLIAGSGPPAVAGDDLRVGPVTWVAIVLMAWGAIATIVAPRFVMPAGRLAVIWALALTPFSFGFAALMFGSPLLVMWIGLVVSVVLLIWVALVRARRTAIS